MRDTIKETLSNMLASKLLLFHMSKTCSRASCYSPKVNSNLLVSNLIPPHIDIYKI